MKRSIINKIIAALAIVFCSLAVEAQLNPLAIGSLKPSDSIVIYYDVTINNPCGCMQISNQGTISGSNIATLNTDDPDTGPNGDATITPLNMYPLPANLLELKAVKQNAVIEISWTVLSETNMIKYEVERSVNGRDFSKIGEVISINSSVSHSYSLVDGSPNSGMNFYRLRLVDISSSKYSTVVRMDLAGKNSSIAIFPNPVKGNQLMLQLNNLTKGNYELVLYSMSGQMVFSKKIYHDGGSANKSIYLPTNLLSGSYSVQVRSEKVLFSQMIVLDN